MKILIIGGTVFLGQAFATEALARGWEVTTFNRGRSAADLPGVSVIRGDRESEADLARLAEAGPWDAVVDVCGYAPTVVGASARALSGRAGSYLYVSTINAVQGWPALPVDESAPLLPGAADAGPGDGDYGSLKAGSERAVEQHFQGDVLVLRPGVVVGPGERLQRVPWWLRRAERGGPMLVGGAAGRTMQLIDVRDLAIFGLDRLAAGDRGAYLTGGEPANTDWGAFLAQCAELTGGTAEPVFVTDEFLLQNGVQPLLGLPLWVPQVPPLAAVWDFSATKALAAGLRCRPVAQTVRDTWDWLNRPGSEQEAFGQYRDFPDRGLSAERERELLEAWAAR
ncbi:NAD-dependent epimerase/dehydratase family protein [Kitasatospora azatica]|uniref:NAD-dependent epimerase/dehydratase family protein n=1 Tax=Kitasatospora azatica TaxID=58347 RepID=UPI00056024BA|nr:NAD-dependent epimerase/dehydratase family protein [Kitasatospora azatica]